MIFDFDGPIKVIGNVWFSWATVERGRLYEHASAGEDREPWRWGKGHQLRITPHRALRFGTWHETRADHPGYVDGEGRGVEWAVTVDAVREYWPSAVEEEAEAAEQDEAAAASGELANA